MNTQPTALTQQRLKNNLHYDKETGIFRWRFARSMHHQPWDQAGGKDNHGYIKIMLFQRMHKAHRLAWLYVTGAAPDGQIDHINGDRGDNRFVNLRVVTNKQNQENTRIRSDNTTGFRGVSFNKKSGMYEASIRNNGKKIHLGMYSSLSDANQAASQARTESFTHDSRAAIAKATGEQK